MAMFPLIHKISRGETSISSFPTQKLLLCALLFVFLLSCSTLIVSAESVPDDFEWKVPTLVLDNEFNQVVKGVYEDIQSETVWTILQNLDPFTGNPDPDEYVVVNRFNTTTHEFNQSFVRDYPGNNNDYIVHGGRWYVFHISDGLLHMRINNSTYDTMKWVYDYSGYQLIGVYDGVIFFILFTGEYGHTVELFRVNISTYAWSREVIIQFNDQGPSWEIKLHHIFKNGTFYLARSRLVEEPNYHEIWLYEYDTDSGHSESPRLMWSSDNVSFGGWDFDMDSVGNFHLLLGGFVWRLNKLTPSMELKDWIDLEVKPGDTRRTGGTLFIMIDRQDTIQVLGSLYYNTTEYRLVTSWTIDLNYSSDIVRKTIFEGWTTTGSIREKGIMCFSDGEVIVCFRTLINDKYMIFYTCKIPPSPDLALEPDGFSYMEQKGTEKPVVVSLRVLNEGRVDARSFNITFWTRPAGAQAFERVDGILHGTPVPPGDGTTVMHAMRLPRGMNTLRVLVHDTVPFENRLENNMMEILVFVSLNNPPLLQVLQPSNDTVVDDSLTIVGTTQDLDDGQEVSTRVDGLPMQAPSVNGTGQWNLTIDTSTMESRDHVLTLRAYDGIDYSGPVLLIVRIDHPAETFRLSSFEPGGDLTLLAGASKNLFVNVTDLFSRHIDYRWTIDGSPAGPNSPYNVFRSTSPGEYVLRVEMTNGRASMDHEWRITVREPVQPSISSQSPNVETIYVERGEEVDLSIQVLNPDGLSYTVLWRRGSYLLSQGMELVMTVSFNEKGTNMVRAIVTSSTASSSSVEWRVVMNNTAPEMVDVQPVSPIGSVTFNDVLVLSVTATDPDGDILTYTWHSEDLLVESINSSFLSIVPEETRDAEVSVTVTISDGEDSVYVEWVLGPVGPQDDDISAGVIYMIPVVVGVAVVLGLYQYLTRKARDRR